MQPSNQGTAAEPVTQPKSLLDQIAEEMAREQAHIGARYMPTLTPKQFTERERLIKDLREMLVEGTDYGVIPGTEKPTLLLPGAQKVCAYFGYVPRYHFDVTIEDWTGQQHGEPLFYYRLVCDLEKDGKRVGSGLGSCNSWETKYRFRWMPNPPASLDKDKLVTRDATLYEPAFAVTKRETGGKYGKPVDYWDRWQAAIDSGEAVKDDSRKTSAGKPMTGWRMGGVEYRVPNENYPDIINTVLKIGKKRAYIDSTLSATGLSQYFTQDLEDLDASGIDTGGHAVGTQAAADAVRDRKLADSERDNPRDASERRPVQARKDPLAELPAELRKLVNDLPRKDGPDKCFDFIGAEIRKAGGKAAEAAHFARMEAWIGPFIAAGKVATLDQMQTQAFLEWGEVERLRAAKSMEAAEVDESIGAFAK